MSDDLTAECHSIIDELSRDEKRVIRFIGRRMLRVGHKKYGPLDLSNEDRTWTREQAEEESDKIFYGGCREVAREDRRAERLQCFKHDTAYAAVIPSLRELVTHEQCTDCAAVAGEQHRVGCPWRTVVR